MDNLKNNIFGGVTAAVVALPLALAFGVSSGAGAAAGLYGAIFVGLFAALFGGTRTQISGPTGPMTVVMAAIITHFIGQYPDTGMALAFAAVMLGGLFQILFGLLRIGKYIILVPYPVISGFMSGIGVIIIVLQLGPFLGHAAGAGVFDMLIKVPSMLFSADGAAVLIGGVTLAVTFFWPEKLSRFLPAPLAALIIGTLVFLLIFPASHLAVIGQIPTGLPSFQMPTFTVDAASDLITYALLLAGLGAIDSLLTSLVADNMTGTKHDSNRELIGQGIGNMVAGAFGALPGAGATMRTAINIKAGGTDRTSGVLHAIVLLVLALGAGGLVENVPYAVLAGILIKVGIDIIDWSYIKRLHRLPLFSQLLMLGVMLTTVFYDLMTAVVLGVFIANMVTIDRLTKLQLDGLFLTDGSEDFAPLNETEQTLLREAAGSVLLFHLDGPMSFGVAHEMKHRIKDYSRHKTLIIDMSKSSIVGITSALAIEDIIRREKSVGGTVYLAGIGDPCRCSFDRLDIFKMVGKAEQFADRQSAIKAAINKA